MKNKQVSKTMSTIQKVWYVTGANKGIGSAIVKEALALGKYPFYRVLLNFIRPVWLIEMQHIT
ncbi:MAG: hypothetical protein KF870_06635 [Leadbetterella sp.]|nr:hypothetical protein [Leadbetterella sp.]